MSTQHIANGEPQAFGLEPRCRVCRNDPIREQVNRLLVTGASYTSIARSLEGLNAELDPGDRVTVDSVSRHAKRHFPVQNAAHATYRQIIEKRAAEQNIDFVNGVATALTPIAVMEVILQKGMETVASGDARVSPELSLKVAEKLHEIASNAGGQRSVADMIVEFDLLIRAVKATVPRDMWSQILEEIEKHEQWVPPETDDGAADTDDADDDGTADTDDDDDDDGRR